MSRGSLAPVAIVVSRYHASLTTRLEDAARAEYLARGGDPANLGIIEAPGTYELVALSLAAANSGLYRGVAALGIVVRGETDHDRYIAAAVAQGLVGVTLQTGVPVALGVITANNTQQAEDRAGGPSATNKGNKGTEAMAALLDTLASANAIRDAADAGDPAAVTPTITRQIAKLGNSTTNPAHGGLA